MRVLQALGWAALAMATPMFGQCPLNPLSALSGAWTFNVQNNQPFQRAGVPGREFVIAGQFTASIGADRAGNAIGVLAINATSVFDQSTTRLEKDAGRYQINANCTGGTLTMNLSSFPMQYDFTFVDGGRSIYIISTTPGAAATGTATAGPLGCPAGQTNLLSLLSGSYAFSFKTQRFSEIYGIAGRFDASIGVDRGGNPIGLLAITATSTLGEPHSVTRLEKDAGRFQINDDCSGGTLTFNLSSRPQQFQFYFRAGFLELDVVGANGRSIFGAANAARPAACPANPLTLLTSTPWTFNVQVITKNGPDANWAATGRFVASTGLDRGGNTIGVLNINATSLFTTGFFGAPSSTRLEGDVGRFQIWDDCTGGTLTMNLSSFPMQYDFWFYNNGQSLYMVSTTPGRGGVGAAHVGVTGCPVGLADPLTLVSGLYAAKIQRIPNFTNQAYGLVGLIGAAIARDRAGNPFGQLGILATSTLDIEGSVTRLETDAGSYQVDADCTTGTLTFNLSSSPAQFQFYFRNGFQTLDVISTRGTAAYGVVSRY